VHARFNVCFDDSAFTNYPPEPAPECNSEAFSPYTRAYTRFPEFPGTLRSAEKIPIKYFRPSPSSPLADDAPLTQIVASHVRANTRMSVDNARTRIRVRQAELTALQTLLAKDDKGLRSPAARKKAEARVEALELNISELKGIVQFHEAVDYTKLPQWAFPLVEMYSAAQADCCYPSGLSVLVNENLLLPHGARRGGPFIAFNVFSAMDDPAQCQRVGAQAPCVLTKLTSQEKALAYLLQRVKSEKALGGDSKSRISAILIIAGGKLSRSRCDNNRTAELIAELRKEKVYTFVPVGNDSDPRAVRFPACASAAISVGSLDRDSKAMAISNGQRTEMVRLYADGDAAVIPMRAPPPDELRGCLALEAFKKTVRNYQKALGRMGFLLEKDSGLVDAETQDALQAFQRAHKLPPNGKLTSDTLKELDQAIGVLNDAQENVGMTSFADEEALKSMGVAENVRLARLSSFEEYDNSLCEKSVSNMYHAYFVGGTLLSAAVMAGTFLDLLDSHPQAGSDAVAGAMLAAPKGKPSRLLTPADFSKTEQKLK
jgi:Putative peptidoglycan binding domain